MEALEVFSRLQLVDLFISLIECRFNEDWWTINFPGLVQCWTGIVICQYYLGIYHVDFTFFGTNRVWVFYDICVFDPFQVYISCKNLHPTSNEVMSVTF